MASKGDETTKYPDVEEEFLNVLQGLSVKTSETVAKYVYDTGDVNLAHVVKALNECDLIRNV